MDTAVSEPVAKSIPEIIKQASQSQLGILALLIIAVALLAIYFFRGASVRVKLLIWLCFSLGAIAYAYAITRVASKPETTHYVGRVLDRTMETPLPDTLIRLRPAPQKDPWRSDSDGRFSFWVVRHKPSDDVEMTIQHEGYHQFKRVISSDESTQLGDIRLARLVASSTSNAATPSPAEGAAHPSAAVGAVVVPARPPPASTSSSAMAVLPPVKVATTESGPKLSGVGKNWSEWYRASVGVAPEGYTVAKTEFWLSGDRSCGAWAECREVSKSDQDVIWEFRMQGHDEWGAPPQAISVGHLRVTYKRST